MVVRFEHFWPMYVLLLIPMGFCLLMIGLIAIWMVGTPKRERQRPEYSLYVMYDHPKTGKGGGAGSAYTGSPYGFTKAASASPSATKSDYSKGSLSAAELQESAYSRGYSSQGRASPYQDQPGYGNPAFDRSMTSTSAYSEKSRII